LVGCFVAGALAGRYGLSQTRLLIQIAVLVVVIFYLAWKAWKEPAEVETEVTLPPSLIGGL